MALQSIQPYRAGYIWETPDDSLRYEVIDGVLYVSGIPWRKHQEVLGNLAVIIGTHLRRERTGMTSFGLGVVLDEYTSVVPDLIYVSRARRHLLSDRGVEGAPDLVVEVLSPFTERRDRGVKMARYARADIPHYWIIDPLAEILEVYELETGAYRLTAEFRDDDRFRPSVIPGLTISLTELWK